MRTGRPSVYDPAMCDRLIEMGKQGWTVVEMAVDLGITKSTLYQWVQEKPDFSDAFTRAREAAEAFHAADYRDHAGKPSQVYNAAGKAKFMGTVFKDWREKTAVELTGKDGAPIQTEDVGAKEIARRMAFALAAGLKDDGGDAA